MHDCYRNTAKTFYAASIFFEILNQFGALQPDVSFMVSIILSKLHLLKFLGLCYLNLNDFCNFT